MISFSTSDRFAHLAPEDKERVEQLTKLDQFAPGEEVSSASKPSEWLGIVASGMLEMKVPGVTGEITIGRIGPGDLYGELETFAKLPEGLRLVAKEETLTRACPKNPLVQELRAHRPLAVSILFAYCKSISEKIRQATDVVVETRERTSIPPGQQTGATRGNRPPHLSADEAQWLAMLGKTEQVAPGTEVVKEGDTTRSFYVIESGEVEVRKGAHVLTRLGPGDMFGFMSFLDGRPRSASVFTLDGAATFTVVEGDALQRALGMNFTVAFKFLATMCGILGRTFAETTSHVIGKG